jgi:hypothetical protein
MLTSVVNPRLIRAARKSWNSPQVYVVYKNPMFVKKSNRESWLRQKETA